MARSDQSFKLRLPDGMRDRIAEAAKANNRSMNAEIVARLEESFVSKSKGSEWEHYLTDLTEQIRRLNSSFEASQHLPLPRQTAQATTEPTETRKPGGKRLLDLDDEPKPE